MSSVLLTRVAHQESKLLIWLRLSAWLVNKDLIATTDVHRRPVRVHAQRSRKGLQAKTRLYKSQIKTEITYQVPGEIKRSSDLRGGRWSWALKFAQKRSRVGRWSWAEHVGTLLLRVVQVVHQQQCNGHCDSVQAQQLKQQLRSALVAGQWRGDTALTLPLFWRRSTVSPVFFGRFPRSSLHSVVPFPLCPCP